MEPLTGGGVSKRDKQTSSGDVDGVGGYSSKERRDDVASVFTGWDDIREDGRLSGEPIKGGEFEAGETPLVELLVGEFVQQDPPGCQR
jgi:hypothetical protein